MVDKFQLFLAKASFIDKDDVNIPTTDINAGRVTNIYELIFAIFGGIALIIIIIAGIKFITSQGDPQATAKARNTIIYAGVGLAVSVAAFSIVAFVLDKL